MASRLIFALAIAMCLSPNSSEAQRPGTINDESKVPMYELPDVLKCLDGTVTDSYKAWETKRRPEVFRLFSDHVYGNLPDGKVETTFVVGDQWSVLDGQAIRKEVELTFAKDGKSISATLLLTIPVSKDPVPCFIGMNFSGNHTTTDDTKVSVPTSWVRDKKRKRGNNQASEEDRGQSASRWPCKEIIAEGFGVGTIYCGDIDPDFDDGFTNGIHGLFDKPTKSQWGTIGGWAWGLSRVLDYLETDDSVDSKRVAVIGHSRLGKTALWAGASDERFWITISNDSGCGGAALHRRVFGETVKVINTNFPHWFCDQFVEYNGKESEIPVDQHMLISLIAPRAVYVASASEDLWADPKGEFLSLKNSSLVFGLYGFNGIDSELPSPDRPLKVQQCGFHLRSGKHDITLFDWQSYLAFAKGLDQQ